MMRRMVCVFELSIWGYYVLFCFSHCFHFVKRMLCSIVSWMSLFIIPFNIVGQSFFSNTWNQTSAPRSKNSCSKSVAPSCAARRHLKVQARWMLWCRMGYWEKWKQYVCERWSLLINLWTMFIINQYAQPTFSECQTLFFPIPLQASEEARSLRRKTRRIATITKQVGVSKN